MKSGRKKNMETSKTSRLPSKKTRSIVYFSIILFSAVILVIRAVLSVYQIQKNQSLKEKEAAIIEKYKDIAQQNNNIKDQDYADVYFEGNNVYIPYEDVILEYEP